MIRLASTADAAQICAIYNHYVANTTITFEEDAVSPGEMAQRIETVLDRGHPWLVSEDAGTVVGYAYLTPWAARSAYRHTLETTIYLAPDATGAGRGTELFGALLDALRSTDAHVAIGIITMPNEASAALHERFGFERVGYFTQVGRKFDRWLDTAMWELVI